MSSKKGRLFVISSSSGAGKTTLAQAVLKKDKNVVQSVSWTTRAPRPGEVHGRDYCFVSKREFLDLKAKRGFLESARVFGKFYGTPKASVERDLAAGRHVLLLIDVQGAKQVKSLWPDAVLIFMTPPSFRDLERRLHKRGTDSEFEIRKRLKAAARELKILNELFLYDYRIVNESTQKACEVTRAIIRAENL